MTSKPEEVARALCVLRGHNPDRRLQKYGRTSSHPAWEDFREDAAAALEAMKSPTEAMLKAAYAAQGGVKDQFNAMIDAALREK